MESSEVVEDDLLEKVAKVLGVTTETIKNFDEEKITQKIQINCYNSVIHGGPTLNFSCTFNPLDKLIETLEENKKLYERLLQSEREKVGLLKSSGKDNS